MFHTAVDVGASGGTVTLGHVTPSTFEVEEVHRFDNRPIEEDGRFVWDVETLLEQISTGIRAADERADGLDTVGIDTWGLDFGLLREGNLLRNPVSYRDPQATAAREELFETVGKRRLFERTGITNWDTPNTLWQFYTLAREEPELLNQADSLLLMPQLLSALLGGRQTVEETVASTTQMVDSERRTWATELLQDLSLPVDLLAPVAEAGERLGPVSLDVDDLSSTPELVTTASHDTASAVVGLPLSDDAAFLNTGTWFILGIVRDEPVRTDAAFEHAASNELGVDGTVRLLKNVNGFFLLEECRTAWRTAGEPVAYDALLSAAREAPSRVSLVDPDADAFGIEDPMPEQIRSYCDRTGQPVPTRQGEIVATIVDSLVAKTALSLDRLAELSGAEPARLNVGGGGVRNALFCQRLADAIGRPVHAGPVEATAVGNLLTQAVTAGTLSDIATGRELVEAEFQTTTYRPAADADWTRAKEHVATLPSD